MDTYSDAAYLSFVLDVVCREGDDERSLLSWPSDDSDTCPCCQRSLVVKNGRCVFCGRIIWKED